MLGWRRDQSGILRRWAKSVLVHVDLLFGLLCAGTGSCDCSPLGSCTELHKTYPRRDIWHWPAAPLLCEGQAHLSISSGFSEPVQQSVQPSKARASLRSCLGRSAVSRQQGWPLPMTWHWLRSGGAGSSSVLLSTRKGSPCRVGPREGSPGWWGAGVSEVEGEAEAAGLF